MVPPALAARTIPLLASRAAAWSEASTRTSASCFCPVSDHEPYGAVGCGRDEHVGIGGESDHQHPAAMAVQLGHDPDRRRCRARRCRLARSPSRDPDRRTRSRATARTTSRPVSELSGHVSPSANRQSRAMPSPPPVSSRLAAVIEGHGPDSARMSFAFPQLLARRKIPDPGDAARAGCGQPGAARLSATDQVRRSSSFSLSVQEPFSDHRRTLPSPQAAATTIRAGGQRPDSAFAGLEGPGSARRWPDHGTPRSHRPGRAALGLR